jgi:hypothetical protein
MENWVVLTWNRAPTQRFGKLKVPDLSIHMSSGRPRGTLWYGPGLPSKVRRELPDLPDRQLNLKVRGPALNLADGPLEKGGFW